MKVLKKNHPPFSKGVKVVLALLVLQFAMVGCEFSSSHIEFKRGKKAQDKKLYSRAVDHFRKVVNRAPESDLGMKAAREAAQLSVFETKNFKEAVEFYRHLVSYSASEKERRKAQEHIAELYFEKLGDFKNSIAEYNRLLMLHSTTDEIINYRFQLAKAHFKLTQFTEAQIEAQEAVKLVSLDDPRRFEIMMFLGSIYFNTKRVDEAIKIYKDLKQAYPERAISENIEMNIIVCHEELEQFDLAIEGLRAIRAKYTDPEFIDLKIRRLLARKANLPGSRGLRK